VAFDRCEPLGPQPADIDAALGALADDPNRNATLAAVGAAFRPPDGWTRTAATPFSSTRKWSAATFGARGTWVLGAPEMVLPEADTHDPVRARADELAASGKRVLVLAASAAPCGDQLPAPLTAVALVLLEEQVRPDAKETLAYFSEQGVALRVISGDNPRTVAAVATRVGLPGADAPYDARELPDDEDQLGDVLETHTVFGRVTPPQKRAMVHALQARGHVVAMTGDGVNDALALKDADIGVAMGSGAAATRAVAQLVLLDGRFATLPGVVAEGRRVIANIERSANLFVTKTVYAVVLAVSVVILNWKYPFLPRHLTIISTFTIGIPGFFLALAPNTRRYIPGFIKRVLRFCVPAGLVIGASALLTYGLAFYAEDLTLRQSRTAAALVVIVIALWILAILARPINWWRGLLVAAMVVSVATILAVPALRQFYAVALPGGTILAEEAAIAIIGIALLELGWRTSRFVQNRRAERSDQDTQRGTATTAVP
jgi:cation-transporting ATPase E